MRIIDWNMSYQNDCRKKIEYLKQILTGDDIVILQEVTNNSYENLKEILGDKYNIEYSLNYRKPGKYDTKSRKLGIAIITNNENIIEKAGVIDRALFPERTLLVDIVVKGEKYRVLGFHSITGCSYKKAKSIQFYSMAEAVDKYRPDIIGMDINEPEKDHYNISEMTFFNNSDKGDGIRTFLSVIESEGLVDSIVLKYDKNKFESGKPLAISHVISKKNEKRYDFVFLNKEKFKDYDTKYNLEDAIKVGGDHAIITVDIKKEGE